MKMGAKSSSGPITGQRIGRDEITVPRRRRAKRREEPEIALRLSEDGIEETIPLTREILLNPTLDIQVPQSPPHNNKLHGLEARLRLFLRPRGLIVYNDVILDWPNVRNVSPDLSIIEDLREKKPGEKAALSVNIAAEKCRVRAAFEVVSAGPKQRWKDETQNPPFFAGQGVDDCVLVYPPEYRKSTDPPLRVFTNPTATGYTELAPDPRGFFLLRSIQVEIGVETTEDGREELVLIDARNGKPLLDAESAKEWAEQEAEARRQAERKADEAERKADEAERKADEEAAARRHAEQLNRDMLAEIERLRTRLGDDG